METAERKNAGFDATVFRDSTGTIMFDTTHTFCGYEGLSGMLNRVEAKNLAEFYPQLSYLALREWSPGSEKTEK